MMLETAKARITDVEVSFDDRGRLAAILKIEGQSFGGSLDFILSNPVNVLRLSMLMNYTNTWCLKNLKGKSIKVFLEDRCFSALGHPEEDKFFLVLDEEFAEFPEAELKMMMENK